MDFVRQLLIWFLSALCVSAGARCAHLLTRLLTQQFGKPEAPTGGAPSSVLCPKCGKGMRRIGTTLVCHPCGHREPEPPAS